MGFLLFLVASVSARESLTLSSKLHMLGFPVAKDPQPQEMAHCGVAYSSVATKVDGVRFEKQVTTFHRNFTEAYRQNLAKILPKTEEAYNQTSVVAARLLENKEYKKVLNLKVALIPFAERGKLKAKVDVLLENSSCLQAQVKLSTQALCALAHGQPESAFTASGVFEIKGAAIARAVEDCSKNIELMCDILNLMSWVKTGKPSKKSWEVGSTACKAYHRWARCSAVESGCQDSLTSVFESFFSPNTFVVTNGYKDKIKFGSRKKTLRYSVSPTGLEIETLN